ncbi:hypothetical protein ACLB2K_031214 [Fragaria x ananassa]
MAGFMLILTVNRYPFDPGSVILNSITEWNDAQSTSTLSVEKVAISVKWVKPPPGVMAYTSQCTSLLIESDSNAIVQMLKKGVDDLYSVLGRCKFLMDKLSMCDVSHVCREINMMVDILSKSRLGSEFGVQYFQQRPPQVVNAALDDLCDTAKFRNVARTI